MYSLIFKSIIVDNGVEFLDMESLEKSVYKRLFKRTTVYYVMLFSPLLLPEKGAVMKIIINHNKLINEFIKKKTDIKYFSVAYIKKIQEWINNYSRKLFNYKTAQDIFMRNLTTA